MPNSQQVISVALSLALVVSSMGLDGCKKKESTGDATQASQTAQAAQVPTTTYAMPTADQLYQLVAPIALFPDNLVAIVLASSTYPDQITASWQWMQQNGGLKDAQLMQAVNQQPWDDSVKGLTQFSDVLQQMATNLSWTSSLGDAYFNAPQNVMNAVQVMRQRAYQVGNLKSTPQQNVQVESQPAGTEPVAASSGEEQQVTVVQSPPQTIVIEPAQPDVVYVPSYNPTAVYGEPVAAPPGYSTGAVVTTALVTFGVGMMIGAAMNNNNDCCGWGYNSWNTGWNNSSVSYHNNVYVSNSSTFVNRSSYNSANVNRNNVNRNNINANNVNRNNLNRGGTPQFDQRRNQGVGDRNQGVGDRNQGVGNRNQGVGDRNQGAGNRNQGVGDRNQGAGNRNQGPGNQRTEQRGYGNQPSRGASNNAVGNYQQGGNARNDSARGKQSVNGGGNRGGANTAQAQNRGGGGGNRGGGNQAQAQNRGGGGGGGGGGSRSGGGAKGGGRPPR
jgi:Protein of unknown function (DUF3300)